MSLIIITHFCGHGGIIDNIGPNRNIGDFLCIGGQLGVNLFIILTGYFMISSKFKIKKLVKLEIQVLIYSIILGGIGLFLTPEKLTLSNIIKCFLPILYWFVTIYAIIYTLSPFINKLINSLTKAEYKSLLIIFVFILSIIPMAFAGFGELVVNKLTICILVYLLGAYIRKYDITLWKDKNYINVLIAILVYIFAFVASKITSMEILRQQNSLLLLIATTLIFMFFKNLKLKNNNNKIILTLGKSSFGVYLLHDNPFFRDILWKKIINTSLIYNQNNIYFLLYMIFSVMSIYIIGVLIELIRTNLLKKLYIKSEFLDKMFNKIDDLLNI